MLQAGGLGGGCQLGDILPSPPELLPGVSLSCQMMQLRCQPSKRSHSQLQIQIGLLMANRKKRFQTGEVQMQAGPVCIGAGSIEIEESV